MAKLKFLSEGVLENLRANVATNLERYKSGDFSSLSSESGWEIESRLEVDLAPLSALDPAGTPDAEIGNSRLVWETLSGMTPSLANEERIWARLTHVECLEFTRKRWLAGIPEERISGVVHDHYFANTRTKRRDDNAISRLWWNAYIANRMMPESNLAALDMILMKADIRSNFVERPRTVARCPLGSAIVEALIEKAWLSEREENFRKFMISLNKDGAGILFEAVDSGTIKSVIEQSFSDAGGYAGDQA